MLDICLNQIELINQSSINEMLDGNRSTFNHKTLNFHIAKTVQQSGQIRKIFAQDNGLAAICQYFRILRNPAIGVDYDT